MFNDATLFSVIAKGGSGAKKAQRVLYQRHAPYLLAALRRQHRKVAYVCGVDAEDVLQDTFERAFEMAASFRPAADVGPERQQRRTRAWLGRIAQRLVVDHYRRGSELTTDELQESTIEAFGRDHAPAPDSAPDSGPPTAPRLRRMRTAFAALNEREQEVLRVTALYSRSEGTARLPNKVSKALSASLGISNDGVRALRSRAIKKLKRAMGSTK